MRSELVLRLSCLVGVLVIGACNGSGGPAPALDVVAEVAADTTTGEVSTDLRQPCDLHADLAPEANVDGITPEDFLVPPEDTVEPPIEVTISSPLPGLVRGTVEFSASATADQGVVKVRFLVDNGLLFEDPQVPYATSWDTSEFDDGEHELEAFAFDTENNTASAAVLVTVDNTSPELSLDSPADGEIQADELVLAATATDAYGMDRVEFSVDNGDPIVFTEEPWEVVFDASALASGVHSVTSRAFDVAGNESVVTREFLLDRPPMVTIMSPEPGMLVLGTITIQAQVDDDVGILVATLLVDENSTLDLADAGGGLFGGDWTPTYEKGERLLTVVIEDSAGQLAEADVPVLVNHPMLVSLLHCAGAVCLPLEEGQELTGAVSLQVEVQDDGPEISGVTLELGGVPLLSADSAPCEFQWDTAGTEDGPQVLGAVAANADGEEEEVLVPVQVNNCDLDHDDAPSAACGGGDCDDDNPAVGPSAPDPIGDGLDANCDGADGVDQDGDGYASEDSGGGDCDDGDPNVHPCAEDVAGDGVDANCDGADQTSCDDCSPCTVDSWLGSQCVHAPYPDGSACDDGDVCTAGDECLAGQCVHDAATDCDDDNPCTTNYCHPTQGCTFENLSYTPCPGGLCVAGACCAPDCTGKACGPDGCGGLCGVCPGGLFCSFDGQCLDECAIAPFSDVAMKINLLEFSYEGVPGKALDLDGDPLTCAPADDCSGGVHNEMGAMMASMGAFVDFNEEYLAMLENGSLILLADFEGLNLDGVPFVMRMFTGEAVQSQVQCDWQTAICPYLVDPESFHPDNCAPVMWFDNAVIVDGKLSAGGPGYSFNYGALLSGVDLTMVLPMKLATLTGDVVIEGGQVVGLENLIFGAAVPRQSILDMYEQMIPLMEEISFTYEEIEQALAQFLEDDIDADGDGVKESISFAMLHSAIPAVLTGFAEPAGEGP